jgi:hypothetical protein
LNDIAAVLTASLDRNGNGSMLTVLKLEDGTQTAPGIAFGSEPTLGLYRDGAGVLGIAQGGQTLVTIQSTAASFNVPLLAGDDQYNLFIQSATIPKVIHWATGNAANTGKWQTEVYGLQWAIGAVNDAVTLNSNVLQATRTAGTYTVATIDYGDVNVGSQHNIHGNTTITADLTVQGGGLYLGTSGYGILSLQGAIANAVNVLPVGGGGVAQSAIEYGSDNNLYIFAPITGTPTGGNISLVYGHGGISHTGLTLANDGTVTINSPQSSAYGLLVFGPGNLHSTIISDYANTQYNAGYLESPIINVNLAYAIAWPDSGKTLLCSSAGGYTVTIPAAVNINFPIGTMFRVLNNSVANISIAIAGTDTLFWVPNNATGTRTLAPLGAATIQKVGTYTWWINGFSLS